MSTTREQAHHLIDQIPEAQLSNLINFLENIVDPIAHTHRNAPFENESIDSAEEQAVSAAREWLKHNQAIPYKQVLSELGLQVADPR